jgi:hypothetical protein
MSGLTFYGLIGMRIISKIKDYYDYLQGILGQDELVVYDRRECFPIDPTKKWGDDVDRQCLTKCNAYLNSNIEKWFRKEPVFGDKKKEKIKRWSTNKVNLYKDYKDKTEGMGWTKQYRFDSQEITEGLVLHFVLEVGYHQYFFEVERYIDDEDNSRLHLKYDLVYKRDIEKDKKISAAPVCLAPAVHQKFHWLGGDGEFSIDKSCIEQKIDNPILFSTYIPRFIEPMEMWNNIYEYISSLRDKEFTDSRTNDQHIESAGFDKKISFRHRK